MMVNCLVLLKIENGALLDIVYNRIKETKELFSKNHVYFKRIHVLNNLAKHLKDNDLLPAIFFSFSRKKVELFARSITTNLS